MRDFMLIGVSMFVGFIICIFIMPKTLYYIGKAAGYTSAVGFCSKLITRKKHSINDK